MKDGYAAEIAGRFARQIGRFEKAVDAAGVQRAAASSTGFLPMSKAKKPSSLADTIRAAVAGTGLSVYAVAKASGISQPMLHRFMAKDRTLTLESADKLCRYLRLELTSAANK